MTIYVDKVKTYNTPLRYKEWCHMMTDQDDLTELHEMAEKLGLRKYFQDHKFHPHYDLTPNKARHARRLGAIPTDSVTMLERCGRLRP